MPSRARPGVLANLLTKPYYVQRPRQLIRRIGQFGQQRPERAIVDLPWGLQIECSPSEHIGGSLYRTGMFELATTEAIFRLVDRYERAIDVGANIGYMTSVMCTAVGAGGRVDAFEPHPQVFSVLSRNVDRWRATGRGHVSAVDIALSDHPGRGRLAVTSEFASNEGTAHLTTDERQGVDVELARLDDVVDAAPIGLLKIDVEGSESAVLQGASRLLAAELIRDVLFEEHEDLPTPVTELLSSHGYTVFDLESRPRGVALRAPETNEPVASWDASTLLATRDPERARRRFEKRGWASLNPRAGRKS